MKFFKKLFSYISLIWKKRKEKKDEEKENKKTSDEFLKEIAKDSREETDKTPDRVDVEFTFSGGEIVRFQIQNIAEIWQGGYVKSSDGTDSGFNANVKLRHRILDVLGEDDARNLGGNQTRLGLPEMPIIPVEKMYYWKTKNGKKMYEVNDVSVYAIRVVNRLKEELGITSDMTNAKGNIRVYRK
jgi:hypothetical protein